MQPKRHNSFGIIQCKACNGKYKKQLFYEFYENDLFYKPYASIWK